MTDTAIQIIFDKEFYESDKFITGKILIKSRVPTSVDTLSLNFTKTRIMEICKIEVSGHKEMQYSKKSILYAYDFDLYKFRGYSSTLSSGSHIFPFKISLKRGDSSTADIKGIYFDYLVNINNVYTITATLSMNDTIGKAYEVKKNVQIVDFVDKTEHFQTNVEMSTIFCFFYKTYTVKFFLNKSLYFSGDLLNLEIDMNRNLLKMVKSIECSLYEVIKINVSNLDVIRTRYIIGEKATLEKKQYTVNLRIPSLTSTSVNEDIFSLKILMFINVIFKNSGPVRIKKYLQIVKKQTQIPDLDCLHVLQGETFDEKIFIL